MEIQHPSVILTSAICKPRRPTRAMQVKKKTIMYRGRELRIRSPFQVKVAKIRAYITYREPGGFTGDDMVTLGLVLTSLLISCKALKEIMDIGRCMRSVCNKVFLSKKRSKDHSLCRTPLTPTLARAEA